MDLSNKDIFKLINLAIDEDIKNGDITTNSIVSSNEIRDADFIIKQNGIIAGFKIARMVFEKFEPEITWEGIYNDGDYCNKNEIAAKVKGNYRTLLSGERTALNFLQRMSGIATKTNKFVKQVDGLPAKILDTRKTVPGHRILDKYAVKMGGGENHRMGLYDMVMIKDNHIKLAGSITKAITTIRKNLSASIRIEVETSTLEEVNEAIRLKPDLIMLDNMNIEDMRDAVKLCSGKILTEASGNISLKNVRDVAETGVDFISVGELTHSVEALDISMKIGM